MASSQVEFASSTSPFGCINTRDRHHRGRFNRERNARATQAAVLDKNLFNHFVRDHLNNNNNSDSWVTNNNAKNNLRKLRFTTNKREQDDSSSVSPRRSQILDQDESSSSPSSSSSSPSIKSSSSSLSSDGSSTEVSNLGASSLVQIWEKRLTQSNMVKSAPRSSPNATASPQGSSEEADCESESTPQGQTNSGDQSEKSVRVTDIIKRLTATSEEMVDQVQEQCCTDPCAPEQSEIKSFGQVIINSPRIRGRQAFKDLLMQMERDRLGELNNLAERAAVSKFAQRGRIQSLLRLRLMQRGVAANDQCCLQSTTPEVIRQPQGSVIMRLRERFSTGVENGTAVETEMVEPRSPCREIANNVTKLDNPRNDIQNPMSHTSADHNTEEAPPSSDVIVTRSEAQNVDLQDNDVETTPSMADLSAKEVADKVEGSEEKHDIANQTSYDEIVEEEEGSEEEYGEGNYDEIEEVETSEQHYDEANFDWISQISRPKSYWEDRRQAWYREMLDTESKNEDICQLLQRRRVSNFLSSDFRERMDRLMLSHKGTQTNLFGSQDGEEENRGKMEHLIALLQQHMHSAKRVHEGKIKAAAAAEAEEEEGEEKHEEQEEEEEILISGSYNGESDSINQSLPSPARTLSSSLSTTWRYRDNEAGYDSEDRLASASLREPSQSQSFYLDGRQNSSSPNPHSIGMELIYGLRGHMKQLYQEMSELRKSIKSCVDMQMILQKSLNRETHTAKGGKKSHDRALKKGNCRICCEMKADSLLYRCGHMCTCLKCANELQWRNGICPICQAPIVDVVRVYVDA